MDRQLLAREAELARRVYGYSFEIRQCHDDSIILRWLGLSYGGIVFGDARLSHVSGFYSNRQIPAAVFTPSTDPMAMWAWHAWLTKLNPFSAERLAESRNRFVRLLDTLKQQSRPNAYVFGTGPSLALAEFRDFSDGYRIACNTVCKDREFFRHLSPDILVAGDALYHFSSTAHAQSFIRDVESRLSERPFYFCYPSLFDSYVRRRLQRFEDYLIPIPIGDRFDLTADMCNEFYLPATGNVLGLLLLPLACQLSKKVKLLGFDGRRPTDQNFWSNADKTSYSSLIDEMKMEFPAFFEHFVPATNPGKYAASVHGDALREALAHAESKGWSFRMLSPSVSPALATLPTESQI